MRKRAVYGFGAALALECIVGLWQVRFADAGDWIPYCRKAKVPCEIPHYDYRNYNPTPPVTGVSFGTETLTEILEATTAARFECGVPVAASSEIRTQIRYWQLAEGTLAIDHCSVSRVGVSVDDFGNWSVSLRAVQDPFVGQKRQALPAARFKRNRFLVTIRGYGAYPVEANPTLTDLGKPELFRIEVPAFWVERSDVAHILKTGRLSPVEARYLSMVDRVEVDFRYE